MYLTHAGEALRLVYGRHNNVGVSLRERHSSSWANFKKIMNSQSRLNSSANNCRGNKAIPISLSPVHTSDAERQRQILPPAAVAAVAESR